ncbi:MAG: autotransporter outer membrane beta-barrel domain-containing protein [Bacteroidota bacterium]
MNRKLMKTVMIAVMLLSGLPVFSQNLDSIEMKIARQPETPESLYYKARAYMLKSLEDDQPHLVKEVLKLYAEKYHDTIPIMYPNEKVLFNFWAGDFQNMLKDITAYGTPGFRSIYYFTADLSLYNFESELLGFFCNQQYRMYNNLSKQSFDPPTEDFLELFLSLSLQWSKCRPEKTNSINIPDEVRSYVAKYPASAYNRFLRENLPPEYEPARFAIGFSLAGGWGDHMQDYERYFNYGGMVGLGLDLEWSRIKIHSKFNGGFGKTQQAFTNKNNHWNEGQKISTNNGEVSAGYSVISTERINLTPTYGIDWMWITERLEEQHSDVDPMTVNLKSHHAFGVTFDWKFGIGSGSLYLPAATSNGFVRVNIAYLIPHQSGSVIIDNHPIDGRALYVNIGYGFTFRGNKRVKF